MTKILPILVLILFTSCASSKKEKTNSGFAVAERFFEMFRSITTKGADGSGADPISVTRTPLPASFRMGVYFLPPGEKEQNWSWSRKEKDHLINSLQKDRRTSRVFELINTSSPAADLTGLRYMAAQQGADVLLIVRGLAQVENGVNAKAITYVALLPMLFVEGNEVKGSFLTQAVLWDVKKPFVHLGAETEGDWTMERPLAFRQKPRALKKSREEALENLSTKLLTELKALKI